MKRLFLIALGITCSAGLYAGEKTKSFKEEVTQRRREINAYSDSALSEAQEKADSTSTKDLQKELSKLEVQILFCRVALDLQEEQKAQSTDN